MSLIAYSGNVGCGDREHIPSESQFTLLLLIRRMAYRSSYRAGTSGPVDCLTGA
jgi:hypothetical protein